MGEGKKSGPARNHEEDKERNRGRAKRQIEKERAEKYDARDGISHCKVFRATAGERGGRQE